LSEARCIRESSAVFLSAALEGEVGALGLVVADEMVLRGVAGDEARLEAWERCTPNERATRTGYERFFLFQMSKQEQKGSE
jgi:hypothetical protein